MKIARLIYRGVKYLFLLIGLALIATIVVVLLAFKDLKAAGLEALAGKNNLEASVAAVQVKDWGQSLELAEKSLANVTKSLAILNDIKNKPTFRLLPWLKIQINDLEYLLQTVDIVNRSLTHVLPIIQEADSLYYDSASGQKFASLSTENKARILKIIYESEPELNGLKANLNLAQLNLSKINKIGVLWPVYSQISDLKDKLSQASALLEKITPVVNLLPALAGYPSSSDFLIIMHNNDELRPSGGFIGVFGLLETTNGDIASLKTYDSYHLDMPAVGAWKMEPPAPIKKYMKVENWYLRDANWSPDWPSSARKIQEIFYGESRAINQAAPEFTGVIGITPELVADLLRLVGPIEVNGEVYNPDNFQSLLQYNVEVAYIEQDINSWDRKNIINDLLVELKMRLYSLETAQLKELLTILDKNIQSKDIQMYFNNTNWQSIVTELGADGAIKAAPSDYLLVVDANLAAFKSDAVVRKNNEYNLFLDQNNKAMASLKLDYQHQGGFDWRTTRYRSYTRVYVPRGSNLSEIKATGEANLEEASIISYDDQEFDKTVFAFFFTLEPGTEGAIELDYELPGEIADNLINNRYQLLAQRQAGRRTENFRVVIDGEMYQQTLNKDLIINYAD